MTVLTQTQHQQTHCNTISSPFASTPKPCPWHHWPKHWNTTDSYHPTSLSAPISITDETPHTYNPNAMTTITFLDIAICIQQIWPLALTLTAADTTLTTHHCHQTSHHDMHAPTMDILNAAIRNHMGMPDVASYLHGLKLLLYTSYFWILEPLFLLLCNKGIVIFYTFHCSNLWFPLLCNKDTLILSPGHQTWCRIAKLGILPWELVLANFDQRNQMSINFWL